MQFLNIVDTNVYAGEIRVSEQLLLTCMHSCTLCGHANTIEWQPNCITSIHIGTMKSFTRLVILF